MIIGILSVGIVVTQFETLTIDCRVFRNFFAAETGFGWRWS